MSQSEIFCKFLSGQTHQFLRLILRFITNLMEPEAGADQNRTGSSEIYLLAHRKQCILFGATKVPEYIWLRTWFLKVVNWSPHQQTRPTWWVWRFSTPGEPRCLSWCLTSFYLSSFLAPPPPCGRLACCSLSLPLFPIVSGSEALRMLLTQLPSTLPTRGD